MIAIDKIHKAKIRIASHYLKKLRQMNQAYLHGSENLYYALESFDAEFNQIEETLNWLQTQSDQHITVSELLLDMVSAGRTLFYRRLSPARSLELHQQALKIAKHLQDTNATLTHLNAIADLYHLVSDNGAMQTHLLEAYELAQNSGLDDKLAECLYLLAYPYQDGGQQEKAVASSQAALELYRQMRNTRNIAQNLIQLGRFMMFNDDLPQAERYLQEARDIANQNNYEEFSMQVTEEIGELNYKRGHFEEAILYHEEALDTAKRLGYQNTEIRNLMNIGILYACLRIYATAYDYFQQALDLTHTTGILIHESSLIANIGYTAFLQGNYDDALSHLEQAQQLFHDEQTIILECWAGGKITSTSAKLGNISKAKHALHRTLTLWLDFEHRAPEEILIPAMTFWLAQVESAADKKSQHEFLVKAVQTLGFLYKLSDLDQIDLDEVQALRQQIDTFLDDKRVNKLLKQGERLDLDTIIDDLQSELKI